MVDLPPRAAPLWAASAASRPPLAADRTADVVVVGGGIAGLTTAVLLARAGVEVVVLEAGAVGQGTTGASTAKVSALQGTRLSAVRRAHGDRAVATYATAQVTTRDWVLARAAGRDVLVGLEERDAVTYADGGHEDELAAELAAAEVAGLPVRVEDAVAELPFPTARALRLTGQAQLDPRAWAADLAAELDDADGAVVHEGTRVADVRGSRVTTEAGHVVEAAHVVVATLLPITDRGALFAQVEPTMSYGVAVTLDEPVDASFPMVYGLEPSSRSLRTATAPDGRPVLVVGGGGHVVGRRSHTLDEPRALVAWARERFAVQAVVARWEAHDLTPIDELPFVGRADPLPGAPWIATGFAKWGMTNGTAAAMTLAGRILGAEPQPWDTLFDPRRSRGLGGVARAATLNASVGREMAWGWVRAGAATEPGGPAVRRRGPVPCGALRSAEDDPSCELSLVCTHLGGIVRWDDAAETWDCPLHGSRFTREGTVVAGPAVRPLHRHG